MAANAQELEWQLQWHDSRLYDAPCVGALGDMISLSREDANSDIARQGKKQKRDMFWVPTPRAKNLIPGFEQWDDQTAFALGADASLDTAAYERVRIRACRELAVPSGWLVPPLRSPVSH